MNKFNDRAASNNATTMEYQCISCGQLRQCKEKCSCSYCGYPMYPAPFDKRKKLIDEINRFINELKQDKIEPKDITFIRKEITGKKDKEGKEKYIIVSKEEDDNRFPSFDKIQKYICAASKTEDFFARFEKTLKEINFYLHAEYKREYFADYTNLFEKTVEIDTALAEVFRILDLKLDLPNLSFPKLILNYSEVADIELITIVDDVLMDLLNAICGKIKKFIKVNNIYGSGYKQPIKVKFKQNPEKNSKADLDKVIATLSKINVKKYVVDILSDGIDELTEMLSALWLGIYALMKLPLLTKIKNYRFEDKTVVIENECFDFLEGIISERYRALKNPFVDTVFTQSKSDDELFELYTQMLRLDNQGILGMCSDTLIEVGAGEKKLNKLIGLKGIKSSIQKIKAYVIANKATSIPNLHMCFYGNPGTGKTEVARIIAEILYENKILPTKNVIEVDRAGLVSKYLGETPIKTMEQIELAMGGVLFIDEAYSLIAKNGGADYGHEAVATLIKAMEDYRGKFCVVLAGYKNQMLEMIASNPGFQSRIQFELDFPNYDREELKQIATLITQTRNYTIVESAMDKLLDITDIKRKESNFANAREIRNILDQVIMCQNVRTGGLEDREIGVVDVNQYIKDSKINLPTSINGIKKKILSGEEELEQLIGIASVKRMIKKIKAYAKRNVKENDFNIHMCFYGNPGTGKTEVARILSRILYDASVLTESKLIEVDSTGLIGKFVGETGAKTHDQVMNAMGGVLFIDEAYGLVGADGTTNATYGDEAIAVLLKDMEDHRGQFCTILAGYKKEMQEMLRSNPGFESRIQFILDFPDYTQEELGKIALKFLSLKKYKIEHNALERILDLTAYYRCRPNFANARTVRNILDQVIMNQNLRAADDLDDFTITLSDVEEYIIDKGIDFIKDTSSNKIGFI